MLDPIKWLSRVNERNPVYTGWYCGTVAPIHVGFYDRCYIDAIYRHYWDGKFWKSDVKSLPHWRQVGDYPAWRGLVDKILFMELEHVKIRV